MTDENKEIIVNVNVHVVYSPDTETFSVVPADEQLVSLFRVPVMKGSETETVLKTFITGTQTAVSKTEKGISVFSGSNPGFMHAGLAVNREMVELDLNTVAHVVVGGDEKARKNYVWSLERYCEVYRKDWKKPETVTLEDDTNPETVEQVLRTVHDLMMARYQETMTEDADSFEELENITHDKKRVMLIVNNAGFILNNDAFSETKSVLSKIAALGAEVDVHVALLFEKVALAVVDNFVDDSFTRILFNDDDEDFTALFAVERDEVEDNVEGWTEFPYEAFIQSSGLTVTGRPAHGVMLIKAY
jgi:hypothetical protein